MREYFVIRNQDDEREREKERVKKIEIFEVNFVANLSIFLILNKINKSRFGE